MFEVGKIKSYLTGQSVVGRIITVLSKNPSWSGGGYTRFHIHQEEVSGSLEMARRQGWYAALQENCWNNNYTGVAGQQSESATTSEAKQAVGDQRECRAAQLMSATPEEVQRKVLEDVAFTVAHRISSKEHGADSRQAARIQSELCTLERSDRSHRCTPTPPLLSHGQTGTALQSKALRACMLDLEVRRASRSSGQRI